MIENDLTAYREQHNTIREEFKKQAANWAKNEIISPHLRWVVERLALQPHFEVLDVAAGTAMLGRAIAPYVNKVIAVDITPEMLSHGRDEAERQQIANITFEEGAAEDLPYPSDSFDLIATRFSVHHFKSSEVVLREMARVCRPGGSLVVIDIVAAEDEELAARYNEVERLRDSSHTQALSPSGLQKLVADAGAEVVNYYSREVENSLEEWLEFAHTRANAREDIIKLMQRDLIGLGLTGMRPFISDDKIMFMHTWGIVVGKKS
jgi:ubiquinone/menaquinone biosynthesis C-methylase UbiE